METNKQHEADGSVSGIIVAVCAVALVIHLIVPERFGFVALALVALALSPWLAPVFESVSFGTTRLQFRVARNEDDIADLKFMVTHFLTYSELRLLYQLWKNQEKLVNAKDPLYSPFKQDMDRLRKMGFVETPVGKGFGVIENSGRDEDVRNHFHIVSEGQDFLIRRERVAGPIDLTKFPRWA